MKKLFATTIILTGLAGATMAQNNKSSWAFNITPKTTKAQLDSVAAVWATHNIILKFTELQFNSKGTKLLQVNGTVDITVGEEHMSAQITEQKVKKAIEIKINNKPSISIDSK